MTAWRERKRLADAERGITTSEAETEQPVTMARVTGAELLRQMRELAGTLTATAERLTATVATLGDTDRRRGRSRVRPGRGRASAPPSPRPAGRGRAPRRRC